MAWQYLLSHLATIITAAGSILFSIHIFRTRRSAQSTLAWLLAFVFVPWFAIPLYLAFGTRKLLARGADRKPHGEAAVAAATETDVAAHPTAFATPIERVLHGSGIPPATDSNALEVFATGESAFAALLALIAEAQSSLHVSMFILGDDETGRAVIAALCKRAREGMEVRMILDAVGSSSSRRRAARELAACGGKVLPFMPLLHLPTRGRSNLRSHRKLIVADGARLFTGGMNLANEYMGATPSPKRWRDVAVLATGPVARDAETLFASDWEFCGGKMAELRSPPPLEAAPNEVASHTATARLQLVPSGPDRPDDAFYDAILVAIAEARRRVMIVTPYYVPDEPLQRTLELCARRGVTTELVMPQRSNHALADFARRSALRDLRAAGVALYGYPNGMVHAKAMVVDDAFAYVGSPNLDMRSLFIDYENALFMYDAKHVAAIADVIASLKSGCERDSLKTHQAFWALEQIARLLAPEL
jgi:cardiolipin synthase